MAEPSTEALIETIRDALARPRSNAQDAWYALRALASLEARLSAAEADTNDAKAEVDRLFKRTKSAEARLKEAEAERDNLAVVAADGNEREKDLEAALREAEARARRLEKEADESAADAELWEERALARARQVHKARAALKEAEAERARILADDEVCACLNETGGRKVRIYERCERCGAFMASDLYDDYVKAEAALKEAREALERIAKAQPE